MVRPTVTTRAARIANRNGAWLFEVILEPLLETLLLHYLYKCKSATTPLDVELATLGKQLRTLVVSVRGVAERARADLRVAFVISHSLVCASRFQLEDTSHSDLLSTFFATPFEIVRTCDTETLAASFLRRALRNQIHGSNPLSVSDMGRVKRRSMLKLVAALALEGRTNLTFRARDIQTLSNLRKLDVGRALRDATEYLMSSGVVLISEEDALRTLRELLWPESYVHLISLLPDRLVRWWEQARVIGILESGATSAFQQCECQGCLRIGCLDRKRSQDSWFFLPTKSVAPTDRMMRISDHLHRCAGPSYDSFCSEQCRTFATRTLYKDLPCILDLLPNLKVRSLDTRCLLGEAFERNERLRTQLRALRRSSRPTPTFDEFGTFEKFRARHIQRIVYCLNTELGLLYAASLLHDVRRYAKRFPSSSNWRLLNWTSSISTIHSILLKKFDNDVIVKENSHDFFQKIRSRIHTIF